MCPDPEEKDDVVDVAPCEAVEALLLALFCGSSGVCACFDSPPHPTSPTKSMTAVAVHHLLPAKLRQKACSDGSNLKSRPPGYPYHTHYHTQQDAYPATNNLKDGNMQNRGQQTLSSEEIHALRF